jgi:methyltransferase (TIGR00027 family)
MNSDKSHMKDLSVSEKNAASLVQKGGTPIRDISDTALWAAIYRAGESERSDALFKDDLAQRLAGQRGKQIADALPEATRHSWVIVVRTYLIDRYILEAVRRGVDMVINLAAGLDTRPYRMQLPPTLQWIEVDLPWLLAYKEDILKNEKPVCSLERISLDLSHQEARQALFKELGGKARQAVIVTEGLLVYLTAEDAASLARDLAIPDTFRTWIFDLHLPGLMRILQQRVGSPLEQAGASLKFNAREGPEFFAPYGWPVTSAASMLETAMQTRRLPLEWLPAGDAPAATPTRSRRVDGFVCSSTRPE